MKQALVVAVLMAAMASIALAQGGRSRVGRREAHLGFWQIRDVQMRLSRLGYAVGEVDGALGPRTRTALRGFQEHRGFRPSGHLDPQTRAALDVTTGSATSGTR